MQLGWIDFSKTDRDKVINVLDLLSEQGVLDELGIARIRDHFSNLFFPGTTTVQTRAKYFFIVPYIFEDLRLNSTSDYYQLKNQLDKKEKKCGEIFRDNKEPSYIGKQSLEQQGKWVKRPPSSIYWAGLKTYEIFNSNISIDQYLKEISNRKSLKQNISKLGSHNDCSDESQDAKYEGDIQNLHLFNIRDLYKEDWSENLEMDLTKEEGAFLKKRIIDSCPDSMIAFILENDCREILECSSFSDLKRLFDVYEFPPHLITSFNLAKRFSDFIFVLKILFNIVASNGENKEANDSIDESGEHMKFKIQGKWKQINEIDDIDLNSIFSSLKKRDAGLEWFLLESQRFMKEEKIDELKDWIEKREISLKGKERAMYHHRDSADKWLAGRALDYRFGIAKTIIGDIFKSEDRMDDNLYLKEES